MLHIDSYETAFKKYGTRCRTRLSADELHLGEHAHEVAVLLMLDRVALLHRQRALLAAHAPAARPRRQRRVGASSSSSWRVRRLARELTAARRILAAGGARGWLLVDGPPLVVVEEAEGGARPAHVPYALVSGRLHQIHPQARSVSE